MNISAILFKPIRKNMSREACTGISAIRSTPETPGCLHGYIGQRYDSRQDVCTQLKQAVTLRPFSGEPADHVSVTSPCPNRPNQLSLSSPPPLHASGSLPSRRLEASPISPSLPCLTITAGPAAGALWGWKPLVFGTGTTLCLVDRSRDGAEGAVCLRVIPRVTSGSFFGSFPSLVGESI